MANTWSALAPVNFMPKVQRYINQRLVGKKIARTDFRAELVTGQTIDWPTTTDMRTQTYTPGTNLTIDNNVAASDTMTINQSLASTWTMDPNSQRQAEDKTVNDKLASQASFRIASSIDQSIFNTAVNGASNTQAGGTLSVSNIYSTLTTGLATLQRNNIDLVPFAVLDPERVALLSQAEIANGFNKADVALSNGFVGDSAVGLKIFRSNNLPTSSVLTMDTQPTANDTITIAGVTWTFIADGGTATAGQLKIGANLSDAQAILKAAINGTDAPSAGDYVDVSTANRRKLQNADVTFGTFSANAATITAYGKQNNSETFTAASNVFGTETGSLLLGGIGAISLGMQIEPTMASAPIPERPMETNYAVHTLFGTKVFDRDSELLVNLTINV